MAQLSSNQFTLTKFWPVLVANVTYSVCTPAGTGEAATGVLVTQSCQPPVPLTSMVANGVAVGEPTEQQAGPAAKDDPFRAEYAGAAVDSSFGGPSDVVTYP